MQELPGLGRNLGDNTSLFDVEFTRYAVLSKYAALLPPVLCFCFFF